MINKFLFFITIAVLILSCSDDKPTNLSDAKEAVKEYYESGKIDEEIKIVVDERN